MGEVTPVIIIARNNLALTKKAVNSALSQNVPVEVLVVDNASTDGTAHWLQTKPIATIYTGEQWALSKCWNAALKALWKLGYDRALVCNNDIVLRPDAVKLLNAHGGPFVTCVSVDTADRMGVEGDREIDTLRETERPHPDFSAFLIRKEVTDKVGWFDERCFPAYTEDSDYHVRIHRMGLRAVCIDVPFLHYGAGTLKSASVQDAAKIRRGADANRQRFKQQYGCLPGTPEYEALFRPEQVTAGVCP